MKVIHVLKQINAEIYLFRVNELKNISFSPISLIYFQAYCNDLCSFKLIRKRPLKSVTLIKSADVIN